MTKNFPRFLLPTILTTILVALVHLTCPSLTDAANKEAQHITVFHTNDIHARMTKGDDFGKSIGLAEMAAAVKAAKTNDPNTLWLDAGDTLHGMPSVNVSHGMNAVLLLNETTVDTLAPGNHDFNYGATQLKKLARKLKLTVLSANIVRKDTGKCLFKESKIFKLPNGVKVGVFGLTTPETAYSTNPTNVANVEFLNPVEVSRTMINKLRPKCDMIIAVMHMGLYEGAEFTSKRIATEAPGIDLIVDGHSHTALPDGLSVGDTLIVQTGWHDYKLGRAELNLTDGKITAKSAKLLAAEDVERLAPVPDTNVLKTLEAIDTKNAKLFGEVVAHTDCALPANRQFLRRHEAEFGNLYADAVRSHTQADIAVVNGGDIRAELPKGDVTRGDIMAVLPFGNTLQKREITGAKIKTMLEHSVEFYPETFGGFLHVSGMTFSFDPTMPVGNRVSDVKIGTEPLDMNKTYTIGAAEFIFSGGDDYDMLKNLPTVGEYDTSETALAEYLNKVGTNGIEIGRINMTKEVPIPAEAVDGEEPVNIAA